MLLDDVPLYEAVSVKWSSCCIFNGVGTADPIWLRQLYCNKSLAALDPEGWPISMTTL